MSNRLSFQTQLASIMEVLANAAVAEICKLVDDDYAVISLQMAQCQRENKALKRKLHLLELRMARGYRTREHSLTRGSRVHVHAHAALPHKYPAPDVFPNQDELYRREVNEDVWRDGESSGTDVALGHPALGDDVNGPEDSNKSGASGVHVKAETADESHTQQQLFIREDGVAEAVCEGREADFGSAQLDKVDAQHPRTRRQALEKTKDEEPEVMFIKEEVSEQERKENRTPGGMSLQDGFVESSTDVCGGGIASPAQITVALGESEALDSSLLEDDCLQENVRGSSNQTAKSSICIQNVVGSQRGGKVWNISSETHHQATAESSGVAASNPNVQRRKRATSLDVLGVTPTLFDQSTPYPPWTPASPSQSQPSCSYIVEDEQDQDCVLVQSAPLSVRAPQQAPDGPVPNRVQDASVPLRGEANWSAAVVSCQPRMTHFDRTEGSRLNAVHTANLASSIPKIGISPQASADLAHPGVSLSGLPFPKRISKGKRKSYICRFCGKAFTGQSNLEAHQRIHTGEKPFKCETCGKLFTEAGNLKKHQRVHTGEKPFVCNRCGKRFAWICNLRTHQQSATCGGVQG